MKRTVCCSVVMCIMAIVCVVGCGGGDSGGGTTIYVPTWITASWSGGAKGPPTDRRDIETTEWLGQICPASSVVLTNHDDTVTFHIANSCTLTTTYAICLTKGSPEQPTGGIGGQCATDPFDTPLSQFTFVTLTTGTAGFDYNSTENLSVNVFYCSDQQQLVAPPLADTVQCL